MKELISLPKEDFQALFDLATSSSGFVSGFMETSDVELLRRLAVLIGADPMDATPHGFGNQYPHAFKGPIWCNYCHEDEDHKIHKKEE